MIQNHLRRFLTNVVTTWNSGQKMTFFMLLMSCEVFNYIIWMTYIKYSSYAQQFVNIEIINTLFPFAIITVGVIYFCAFLFYKFQDSTRFIHGLQLLVMLIYTAIAGYVGYLVGQDNIMSAVAISTAGLLIVLFCERKFSYWIVALNLCCMFGIMYAVNTNIFPPPEFYIGKRDAAFWVFSYISLCGLKIMTILLIADNMLYVLKESYKQQKFLSEHDALTELPNRLKTQAYLIESINSQNDVGLIMVDLDHFKQINDSYGHMFGDNVLIQVAQMVNKHVRKHDMFGRYGGEEFVMVLPNTTMSVAKAVANRLHQAFNAIEIPIDNGSILKPTASFGVVATDYILKKTPNIDCQDTLKQLFGLADAAMYSAKKQGRNRVVSAEELPKSVSSTDRQLSAHNPKHFPIKQPAETSKLTVFTP